MSKAPYRVFYLNNFITEFSLRDTAIEFVMHDATINSRATGDYEILDASDYL